MNYRAKYGNYGKLKTDKNIKIEKGEKDGKVNIIVTKFSPDDGKKIEDDVRELTLSDLEHDVKMFDVQINKAQESIDSMTTQKDNINTMITDVEAVLA